MFKKIFSNFLILGVMFCLLLCLASLGLCAGRGNNFHDVDTNSILNTIFNRQADFANLSATYIDSSPIGSNTPAAGAFTTLGSTGNFNVNNKLNVTATNGNTLVGGTLGVTGDTNINSKVNITASSGNTQVGGTLGSTGNFNVNNNMNVTAASGNTQVGGTLGSTGNFNVNNEFNVTAASGNTITNGTFTSKGDFNVNNNFNVTAASGNVAINGTLTVPGGAGVTAASSYWLCTAANCSTACQANVSDGVIIGCQ